jgi:putative transposase
VLEPPQGATESLEKTQPEHAMGHTYSNPLVHVIFSTKRRAALITPQLRPRLYEYLAGVAKHEFGHAVEIGGTSDHLHGLTLRYMP